MGFSGEVSNSKAIWEGEFELDGGTNEFEVEMSFNNSIALGDSTWSWQDGSFSCSGDSIIESYCASGECLTENKLDEPSQYLSLWDVAEVANEVDCGGVSNEQHSYQISIV